MNISWFHTYFLKYPTLAQEEGATQMLSHRYYWLINATKRENFS